MTDHSFPLSGIIGIVANGAHEIDLATDEQLTCVEIRADLLLQNGLTIEALLDVVAASKKAELSCLFTLRHPSHGGAFEGDEDERVAINRRALEAGADIIDLEWRSKTSESFTAGRAPLILSHHDFEAMPDEAELTRITTEMLSNAPTAIKVVPTAVSLKDAVRMLTWVRQADDSVRRIGFAMGASGACSRILTLSAGAPITYASFGASVAPGQVALQELRDTYEAPKIGDTTPLVAVAGTELPDSSVMQTSNALCQSAGTGVSVPLCGTFDEIEETLHSLTLRGVLLQPPLDQQMRQGGSIGDVADDACILVRNDDGSLVARSGDLQSLAALTN